MMESKNKSLPIIWNNEQLISKTYNFTFEHNPEILNKSKIYVRPQLIGSLNCTNILSMTEDKPYRNIEISIIHKNDFEITPPKTQEM